MLQPEFQQRILANIRRISENSIYGDGAHPHSTVYLANDIETILQQLKDVIGCREDIDSTELQIMHNGRRNHSKVELIPKPQQQKSVFSKDVKHRQYGTKRSKNYSRFK